MADVLSPEQRRLNMSRIRSRDTKPEMLVRKGLHALGLRYKLHDRNLPGRPDLVFPKYRTVVFVHGCFWHAHGCALSKLPTSRRDFWAKKLEGNSSRDRKAVETLLTMGWHVLVIWECALRGPHRLPYEELLNCVACYVVTGSTSATEISGNGRSVI
ncbi:very short patch repair endonuclease [Ralstonia solanacearum species complex bacterium KE056]|uniref:very short patch repair endonuclease n=1 Tax=Ralstonia solanacearum species complex bacterium KE056 TaxID=3119585 RepID=UPI002FC3A864